MTKCQGKHASLLMKIFATDVSDRTLIHLDLLHHRLGLCLCLGLPSPSAAPLDVSAISPALRIGFVHIHLVPKLPSSKNLVLSREGRLPRFSNNRLVQARVEPCSLYLIAFRIQDYGCKHIRRHEASSRDRERVAVV